MQKSNQKIVSDKQFFDLFKFLHKIFYLSFGGTRLKKGWEPLI